MKTILSSAAVALALVLAGGARFAVADEERRTVDPSLQGVWRISAFSLDEGLNMNEVSDNTRAVVTATEITMPDGRHVAVKRVRLFTDDAGHPAKWIFLSNGEVLEVTGEPGQKSLVKVLTLVNDRIVEEARFEMTIDNTVSRTRRIIDR